MHTFSLVSVGFVPGQQDLTSDAIEPLIKVQGSSLFTKMPSGYAWVRFSFGREFDDSYNMCNILSRWAHLQDVKILTDSDLEV